MTSGHIDTGRRAIEGLVRGESLEDTAKDLERALEGEPNNLQRLLVLGNTYYWQGKIKAATQIFERAIELNAKVAVAQYFLGLCCYRSSRLQPATVALEKAVALDPTLVMARYWLGVTYYHQGSHEKALQSFESLCQVSPESEIAHYHAALCCSALGRWECVRDHLEFLAERRTDDTRVFLHLGKAYRRLNQPLEAAAAFRRGLEVNPHDQTLVRLLAQMTDVQAP